jgi:hypothetical protein
VKPGRRFAGALVAALAIVVGASGFASTAHAATAYRYWTYYVAAPGTASWTYSQRGPASEHPQDGEVQGWRFAIQADRSGGLTPRLTPDFAKLCGTQAAQTAQAGRVRVGIVLDFGVADDAPAGERPPAGVVTGCVQVADGANGVDVLDAAVGAANVRIGQGLICGINGYPKSECADAVAAPKPPSPKPAPSKSATQKPPATTAKPATTQVTTAASSPSGEPTASASSPSPTAKPTLQTTVVLSASAPTPSPSASASVSSLGDLKKPSNKVFPTGAVIGVVLVLGLAVAAIARGTGGRK